MSFYTGLVIAIFALVAGWVACALFGFFYYVSYGAKKYKTAAEVTVVVVILAVLILLLVGAENTFGAESDEVITTDPDDGLGMAVMLGFFFLAGLYGWLGTEKIFKILPWLLGDDQDE